MKINTTALARALAALERVAGKRTPMPVLNTVRIEAQKGVLTLQATNLESFVSLDVECQGDLVACCVPARVFRNVVGMGDTTELELLKGWLHVSAEMGVNNRNTKIPTIPADTFPACAVVKEFALAVDCRELAKAIDRAGYAFSAETDRPVLHNVMFLASKGQMAVVSTNGRHLAECVLPCDAEASFMVPACEISTLVAALTVDKAELQVGENWIHVSHADGFSQVKLSDLQMPNVMMVANSARNGEKVSTFNREELTSALDMCRKFVTDKTFSVKFEPKKKQAQVSVDSEAGSIVETISCDRALPLVAFDPDYMLSALRRITGEQVTLGYEDDKSPIVIKETPFMAVIMPCRTS